MTRHIINIIIIKSYFILDRSHGERRMEKWWRSSVPKCKQVGQRSTGAKLRPREEWALWTALPSIGRSAEVTPRLGVSLLLRS